MNALIDSDPGTSYGSPNFREFKIVDMMTCTLCKGAKQFSLCCGGWIRSGECSLCKAKCTPADCSECDGTGAIEDKL